MAKKKSAKGASLRKEKAPAAARLEREAHGRSLIRAIRVSQEVLDAAKALYIGRPRPPPALSERGFAA